MSKDKAFDSLDETFNIEPDRGSEKVEIVKTQRDEAFPNDRLKKMIFKKDYTYQRAQLYDLVEKMQETLNESMDAAMQSATPPSLRSMLSTVLKPPLMWSRSWQISRRR